MNKLVLFLIVVISFDSCSHKNTKPLNVKDIKAELNDVLVNNILKTWYPNTLDTIYGGYSSNYDFKWKPLEKKEKMIVTQSRGIWTCSKAAMLFPDGSLYKTAAKHGVRYIIDKMWDNKKGGFITLTQSNGKDHLEFIKTAYGNAFAIYGLSAYYELTKNEEAKEYAMKTFNWLEEYCHDSIYGGYFNSISIKDNSIVAEKKIPHRENTPVKDFNSSIHILEAFSSLYKIWPDELVKKRLEEMLFIVRDTICNPKGYLNLYFDKNWARISFKELSGKPYNEIVKKKSGKYTDFDHISFGHDVETAYLLLEASHNLYGEIDPLTMKAALNLVNHAMKYGFDKNYYGLFDKGFYIKNDTMPSIIKGAKIWWSQAEALNTALLFSVIYPENNEYRHAFGQMWKYIRENLIDYKHGDWYREGTDITPGSKKELKADIWKGNYHTSRALMNCINMLNGKEIF